MRFHAFLLSAPKRNKNNEEWDRNKKCHKLNDLRIDTSRLTQQLQIVTVDIYFFIVFIAQHVTQLDKHSVRTGQAQQEYQHTDCIYGHHTDFVRIVTITILFHIGQF